MNTKHNDDILKTMTKNCKKCKIAKTPNNQTKCNPFTCRNKREPLKERDEQPPATPQPKKQCINCINHIYCKSLNTHYCAVKDELINHVYKTKDCNLFENRSR